MPSLTYEYVYFGSNGPHTRQPRATNAYGGFTPVPGLNSSVLKLATSAQFGVRVHCGIPKIFVNLKIKLLPLLAAYQTYKLWNAAVNTCGLFNLVFYNLRI